MRLAAALLLLALAPAAPAADWGVSELFRSIADERPGRATFRERKHLAILDRPVESSGELAFIPPDRLEKRTLLPRPELVTVERERITLERGGKRHTLGLRANPAIAVLVESIRATLAGELDTLTKSYSVALDGTPARWKLTLRPLDAAAQGLVDRIELAGAQARVATVEIFQADGDRSVMTITPMAP